MIHQRQATAPARPTDVPRVQLPDRIGSCIVITPDGEVAVYSRARLTTEKRQAMFEAAREHHGLIHNSRSPEQPFDELPGREEA